MSEPFIGQISMFGFNFAPRGWSFCSGQILSISQNTALFSLLGTTYGGDGRSTFALPDFRGRFPMSYGAGPGLPSYPIGMRSGRYAHQITLPELPSHTHGASVEVTSATLAASTEGGSIAKAEANAYIASQSSLGADKNFIPNGSEGTTANLSGITVSSTATIQNTGGSQAMNITNPFLAINFSIALMGIYPSRN
ncbi:Microcystin dependent protein [hydrothermal vent metagenome]|uniref:Microcystin dependent protein n=1 Tax=hydrothermal vent metagenome TaxID=652676 RepID=A0A3B1BHP0_9ZZZZ